MTQYLIYHKVRGEPSFDCAEPVCSGNGEPCQPNCGNWIDGKCAAANEWVTNSGYRAYPWLKWNLNDLPEVQNVALLASGLPADWPDHFEVRKEPKHEIDLGNLLVGLVGKFPRRA